MLQSFRSSAFGWYSHEQHAESGEIEPHVRLQSSMVLPTYPPPMSTSIVSFVVLLTITTFAHAVDTKDAGMYAIVHRDGHTTQKIFRVRRVSSSWVLEDKRSDGTWKDVTCEADCVLRESAPADLRRFFSPTQLEQLSPSCIHNTAFAFCNYTRAGSKQRAYVMVALVTGRPLLINLARLPS